MILGSAVKLRERVEQDRVQTTRFEVTVVEEGIGLADGMRRPGLGGWSRGIFWSRAMNDGMDA
jgi:hypothetical protein